MQVDEDEDSLGDSMSFLLISLFLTNLTASHSYYKRLIAL